MPTDTIYVGRPSQWGNPFKVGGFLNAWGAAFIAIELGGMTSDGVHKIYNSGIFDKPITLKDSLKYYELWIRFRIKRQNIDIKKLKGKNLACFCALESPCHADILLKLANP